MNSILPYNNIDVHNVFFLEPKLNTIIDGIFTKLIYSTSSFIMNGLFLTFPLKVATTTVFLNKMFVKLDVMDEMSIQVIQQLSRMELEILQQYNRHVKTTRSPSAILSKQLMSGSIKLSGDRNVIQPWKHGGPGKPDYGSFILKISGIWESQNEVGLTYKLVAG
jgi:hypothetical protein